jgi:hypothetical protein
VPSTDDDGRSLERDESKRPSRCRCGRLGERVFGCSSIVLQL